MIQPAAAQFLETEDPAGALDVLGFEEQHIPKPTLTVGHTSRSIDIDVTVGELVMDIGKSTELIVALDQDRVLGPGQDEARARRCSQERFDALGKQHELGVLYPRRDGTEGQKIDSRAGELGEELVSLSGTVLDRRVKVLDAANTASHACLLWLAAVVLRTPRLQPILGVS